MYRVDDETTGGRDVVVLRNDAADFSAAIAPGFGGACVSLRHCGHELLHGAGVFDKGPMKGRMPVLFPVVGRSFEKGELGIYRHRGKVYPMDIHGFVKDLPWREVQRRCGSRGAAVTCGIESSNETRRSYPYDFSLAIEYAVEDSCLAVTATVRNLGADPMPFCFGYHPYFRAPIGDGRRGDCVVRIPGGKIWEMRDGQPTGRRLDAPAAFAAGARLPPDHLELIFCDIRRPEGARAAWCELECPEVNKLIRIEFDERALETITVYAPPDSGFVCIEPRCGLPNALSDSAPVRDGVKVLPAAGEFTTRVCIGVQAVGTDVSGGA